MQWRHTKSTELIYVVLMRTLYALMCTFCILYFQILRTYIHVLLSPVASYISERFSYRRGQNHLPPPFFFNTKVNRSDPGCMREKIFLCSTFVFCGEQQTFERFLATILQKQRFFLKTILFKNHAIFSNNKNANISLPYNLSFPTHIILTLWRMDVRLNFETFPFLLFVGSSYGNLVTK